MRTVVLWGLLALLCLCKHTLVSGHVLGRPYSASDAARLKSLLERFEEVLAEAAPEEDPETDYEGTNPQPERSPAARGEGNSDQEGAPLPPISNRPELSVEAGHSRAPSQRSRLLDLLRATRSRSSGCFGARMDRIGNSSRLGCGGG